METNNDSSVSPSFKLLQPELMTVEELNEILRGCCVKNDLTTFSKSELVELFKRVALPLPQREYEGNNWREKLLVKSQKRKDSESVGRNNLKKLCTTNGSSAKSTITSAKNSTVDSASKVMGTSTGSSNANRRLKPPPINLNNYTKKVLKLSLPNSKDPECPDTKNTDCIEQKDKTEFNRKIVIENVKKIVTHPEKSSEKQTLTNGKHKRIVIDFSDSSTTTTKNPKVVNLKRSTSTGEIPDSKQKIRKTKVDGSSVRW